MAVSIGYFVSDGVARSLWVGRCESATVDASLCRLLGVGRCGSVAVLVGCFVSGIVSRPLCRLVTASLLLWIGRRGLVTVGRLLWISRYG